MSTADDLAAHIRTELSAPEPAGFGALRQSQDQGDAVARLAESLRSQPADLLGRALALAVEREPDPWTFVKLVELCGLVKPAVAGPALLRRVENPPSATDERRLYLQGCACEVLLGLDLDEAAQRRATSLCGPPLSHLARVRASVDARVRDHRPRVVEWAIVVVAMLLAAAGVAYVLLAD